MIFGQVTSQVATIILGLCWPGYQSFKASNLGNSEALQEWLVYWIVLALCIAVQWLADQTICWLPLYYDAKVALVVMLWHPKVRGAAFLYSQYLKPLLCRYEASIDQSLVEAKTHALDYVSGHLQRAKNYALQHTSHLVEHVKTLSEQTATGTSNTAANLQQRTATGVSHPHAD